MACSAFVSTAFSLPSTVLSLSDIHASFSSIDFVLVSMSPSLSKILSILLLSTSMKSSCFALGVASSVALSPFRYSELGFSFPRNSIIFFCPASSDMSEERSCLEDLTLIGLVCSVFLLFDLLLVCLVDIVLVHQYIFISFGPESQFRLHPSNSHARPPTLVESHF